MVHDPTGAETAGEEPSWNKEEVHCAPYTSQRVLGQAPHPDGWPGGDWKLCRWISLQGTARSWQLAGHLGNEEGDTTGTCWAGSQWLSMHVAQIPGGSGLDVPRDTPGNWGPSSARSKDFGAHGGEGSICFTPSLVARGLQCADSKTHQLQLACQNHQGRHDEAGRWNLESGENRHQYQPSPDNMRGGKSRR